MAKVLNYIELPMRACVRHSFLVIVRDAKLNFRILYLRTENGIFRSYFNIQNFL